MNGFTAMIYYTDFPVPHVSNAFRDPLTFLPEQPSLKVDTFGCKCNNSKTVGKITRNISTDKVMESKEYITITLGILPGCVIC